MTSNDIKYLTYLLDKVLPEGVVSYGGLSEYKHAYIIRFVSINGIETHVFKEYNGSIKIELLQEYALKEAIKFTEYWNSPLMKALR